MPEPNGVMERSVWDRCEPLNLVMTPPLVSDGRQRELRLRAVHDSRAIAFLVLWADDSPSLPPRWFWDRERNDYLLDAQPVDQIGLLWALERGDRELCMTSPKPHRRDLWQWQAFWSELSGYAMDRVVTTLLFDEKTSPALEHSPFPRYPLGGGRMLELRIEDDPGVPGTLTRGKPVGYIGQRIRAFSAQHPAVGSAADVQAMGVYHPASPPDIPSGQWFVEFFRLLVTADKENDVQLDTAKTYWCRLSMHNNQSGDQHYLSEPFRVRFAPRP